MCRNNYIKFKLASLWLLPYFWWGNRVLKIKLRNLNKNQDVREIREGGCSPRRCTPDRYQIQDLRSLRGIHPVRRRPRMQWCYLVLNTVRITHEPCRVVLAAPQSPYPTLTSVATTSISEAPPDGWVVNYPCSFGESNSGLNVLWW